MEISIRQKLFLSHFVDSRGNLYSTLQLLDINLNSFREWRKDKNFDLAYREVQRELTNLLKEENYQQSLLYINRILQKGEIREYQRTWNNTNKVHQVLTPGGDVLELKLSEAKNSRTERVKGIPIKILEMALQESTVTRAIEELVKQNIIPNKIAKRIKDEAEGITERMKNAFGEGNQNSDSLDEQEAIRLIKYAVLGNPNILE